jgi:predicted transcriptional regulator
VAEVLEDLESGGVEVAYTTVQTLLNRLVEKGAAIRQKQGRAFVYQPALERPTATGRAVSSVVERFFSGSAEALARHLVESDLDPEEIDRLQRFIDGHAKEEE